MYYNGKIRFITLLLLVVGFGTIVVFCAPPANNDCSSYTTISLESSTAFNTNQASTDGNSHTACSVAAYDTIFNDVWYCLDIGSAILVNFSACFSDFDTKMALYEVDTCGCPAGDPVVCADNDECTGEFLTYNLDANKKYMVRVGGYDSMKGTGWLDVNEIVPFCGDGLILGAEECEGGFMCDGDCLCKTGYESTAIISPYCQPENELWVPFVTDPLSGGGCSFCSDNFFECFSGPASLGTFEFTDQHDLTGGITEISVKIYLGECSTSDISYEMGLVINDIAMANVSLDGNECLCADCQYAYFRDTGSITYYNAGGINTMEVLYYGGDTVCVHHFSVEIGNDTEYCGDAICNNLETCQTCESDCGACCGNAVCDYGENCVTCSSDCSSPCGLCGDGSCVGSEGENLLTCMVDCPPECEYFFEDFELGFEYSTHSFDVITNFSFSEDPQGNTYVWYDDDDAGSGSTADYASITTDMFSVTTPTCPSIGLSFDYGYRSYANSNFALEYSTNGGGAFSTLIADFTETSATANAITLESSYLLDVSSTFSGNQNILRFYYDDGSGGWTYYGCLDNILVYGFTPGSCPDGTCDADEDCQLCSEDCGQCCGNGVCDAWESPDTCTEDCTVPLPVSEDFQSDVDEADFDTVGGYISMLCGAHSGNSLVFYSGSERHFSLTIDVSSSSFIVVDYWIYLSDGGYFECSTFTGALCNVTFTYSADGGGNQTVNPGRTTFPVSMDLWTHYRDIIDVGSYSYLTLYWRQNGDWSLDDEMWAIDELSIEDYIYCSEVRNWNFETSFEDDGGNDLYCLFDDTPGYTASPVRQLETFPDGGDKYVVAFQEGTQLKIDAYFESSVTEYTIIFDILFQGSLSNALETFFLKINPHTTQPMFGFHYDLGNGPHFPQNTWVRVAFVSNPLENSFSVYQNGFPSLVMNNIFSTQSSNLFSMPWNYVTDFSRGDVWNFFGEYDSGNYDVVPQGKISSIQIRDYAMSPEYIGQLGGTSSAGIIVPNCNACCGSGSKICEYPDICLDKSSVFDYTCGDANCDYLAGETCSTCSDDCGKCGYKMEKITSGISYASPPILISPPLGDIERRELNLNFLFQFFGSVNNKVYLYSNGFLTFHPSDDKYDFPPDMTVPMNGANADLEHYAFDIMAPMWDDLRGDTGGNIWAGGYAAGSCPWSPKDGSLACFAIRWDHIKTYGGVDMGDFEVILYINGDFAFIYNSGYQPTTQNQVIGVFKALGSERFIIDKTSIANGDAYYFQAKSHSIFTGGDSDGDFITDPFDFCPSDPFKEYPGICGCGEFETPDSDGDGTYDCFDACIFDPDKIAEGYCGCGSQVQYFVTEDYELPAQHHCTPDIHVPNVIPS